MLDNVARFVASTVRIKSEQRVAKYVNGNCSGLISHSPPVFIWRDWGRTWIIVSQDVGGRTVFWIRRAPNTKQKCYLPTSPGISVLNMKIGAYCLCFSHFGRWPWILVHCCSCFGPPLEAVHVMIVSTELTLSSCSVWYAKGCRCKNFRVHL
jgi:hypothetical protein